MGRMRFPIRHGHAQGITRAQLRGPGRNRIVVTLCVLCGVVAAGAMVTTVRGTQQESAAGEGQLAPSYEAAVAPSAEGAGARSYGESTGLSTEEDPTHALERVAPQTMSEAYATVTLTALDFVQSLDQAAQGELFAGRLRASRLSEPQRAALVRVARAMLGDAAFVTLAKDLQRAPGEYLVGFSGGADDRCPWTILVAGPDFQAQATVDPDRQTVATIPVRAVLPAQRTPEGTMPSTALTRFYGAAFAFFESLDDHQRAELYTGAEPEASSCLRTISCDPPKVSGLKAGDLNDAQLHLLLDLIAEGSGLADPGAVTAATNAGADMRSAEVSVEWSGAQDYDTAQGRGIGLRIATPHSYFELVSDGWSDAHSVYLAS